MSDSKHRRVEDSDRDRFLEARAVTVIGEGAPSIIFLHGFGADQTVWREVAPAFGQQHEVVAYDQMGSGRSMSSGQDHRRYRTLDGYAEDLVTILDRLEIRSSVIVGHSISGMIGLRAAALTPRICGLAMIASSPRYLNDTGYIGGFEPEQIDDLLASMELDLQGWVRAMAQTAMAGAERPDLAEELAYRFSHANPELLRSFARATFLSDHRALLSTCGVPTLLLQPQDDAIVPWEAAQHMASQLPSATLRRLSARGHYPQLSASAEVVREIADFMARGF